MANAYTQHYGLCQWAAEDDFLRAEFNQDNARVDEALHENARRGERTDYHLCNLLLQREYEGKDTGFKRALLFDGFQDMEGVAARSGFLPGAKCLVLSVQAQGDVVLPENMGSSEALNTPKMTMTGSGRITGFQYLLYAEIALSGLGEIDYALTVNGEERAAGTTRPAPPPEAAKEERTLTLAQPVEVCAGDVCVLRMECRTSGLRLRKGEGDTLCGTLRVQSAAAESGSMTAAAAALPACAGASAWVRHQGGTVGLSLKKGGTAVPFTRGETRDTTEPLEGAPCTETAFSLEGDIAGGEWQVVLTGALESGETEMRVYDYGVMLC